MEIILKKISKEEYREFSFPLSYEEIKEVVWSYEGGKSLGPDEFGFSFYKSCWEIVWSSICEGIQEFYQNATLLKVVTFSLLALIQKIKFP